MAIMARVIAVRSFENAKAGGRVSPGDVLSLDKKEALGLVKSGDASWPSDFRESLIQRRGGKGKNGADNRSTTGR